MDVCTSNKSMALLQHSNSHVEDEMSCMSLRYVCWLASMSAVSAVNMLAEHEHLKVRDNYACVH